MKVGVITFHGSHNHGSVLQAYATQETIKKLGYDVEIINFRMESQKRYYSLYPRGYGIRMLGQDILMLPLHLKRRERAKKFEDFIGKMNLSGPEMKNREELQQVVDRYDVYLTGSDQIWSNRIPELVGSSEDFTGVYFLDFAKNDKPRIAYASSVGEITYEELKDKKKYLDKFTYISTREKYGVDLLERITGKNIDLVLDPTFLLDKSDWSSLAGTKRLIKEPYIFLYTLHGLKHGIKWGKALSEFGKNKGLKVVAVSPFFPITHKDIQNVVDAGPLDFLNLIKNAEIVFTDSFHGTAFSINLNKPFFSYIGKNTGDNRKLGIMKQFGLENRAIESLDDIRGIKLYDLEYDSFNEAIENVRKKSLQWITDSLEMWH